MKLLQVQKRTEAEIPQNGQNFQGQKIGIRNLANLSKDVEAGNLDDSQHFAQRYQRDHVP
jgi:hypothetical protein